MFGWYYQHTNGDLIFQKELLDGGTAADIRESTFAKAMWPVDPNDRKTAWRILIEGLAGGADSNRVEQLAAKWECDNKDAPEYASRVGVKLSQDGNMVCATRTDFENLQESPAGFGPTSLEAMAALCKELGYKPQKTWGNSFEKLLG